ncbi:alpha-helical ferredoxin [Lucifera butyrica]|uniref:Alpha-helical ferredoxin n=1 Tax=Lucifera butyrica TaxID=1351585 RepID=A0A498RFD6_9FIRM|nr:pyridine nucleotide-disulfide oxidoreductase/dicluster-binding protein [Lucifera butyrica]VBB08786.1 alpha-helical ferredoxin [Lucifera butyrica]VBB08803.1 alpha-helical ferredoxin [Lucifera butyrica]
MEQKQLREREARCVQENPPGCSAGCPVHVDARGMIAAIRREDYAAAMVLFRKMVPFPGIISRVCDQPCRQSCKRKEIDEPVSINALEKVCFDRHQGPVPKITILPARNKSVAIVGGGLSGLTAAFELSCKGYKTVVFEATDRLGGSLWDIPADKLPRELMAGDFAVLEQLPVEIRYNAAIGNRGGSLRSFNSLCEEFDAVYVGIGSKEKDSLDLELATKPDGEIAMDPLTLATSHPRVFAGGSLRRRGDCRSPAASLADGKMAAVSIDRLLQNASLTANRGKEGAFTTSLYTDIEGIEPAPVVRMTDPGRGYTREEALEEAKRCLQCECMECVKACEYLAHYGSYPKRYVREVYNNLSIVMGVHHANKMINTCSLCGLCEQVCPGNLNMGDICREARQMMVKRGKMPPSVHDFAIRDMQFSNSDRFVLDRHQPGFTSSETVFFPGCQLAASSPQSVKKIYEHLCAKTAGGVGLMLGCCGAPANWAGQEELFQETLQNIESRWRELGSPKVITACPTCFSMFEHNLPAMPVEMLWTLLERTGLPDSAAAAVSPRKVAIHDSCTTRHETGLHNSVRQIVSKLGWEIEELPRNRDNTVCCGYGGLMIYANREVARKVINRRIKESGTDYLTYCAMCRDNFASQGKRVYHLLDLILGTDGEQLAEREPPGYSERQENRARLKRSLLRDVWGEDVEAESDSKITIPENVRRVMEERMILTEDVAGVIRYAEDTGNKMKNTGNGHFIAYLQPAGVTYWVEYSPQEDGFLVHNAYCHRLEIEE